MDSLAGCPWSNWAPSVMTFCEQARCAWIREPLNTWSNLGFVFVGVYLLRKYGRTPQIRLLGWSALLVGVTSGFNHATQTFAAEAFDLGSMYLLMGAILSFNLNRLGLLTRSRVEPLALFITAGGFLSLFIWRWVGVTLFNYMVAVYGISEAILFLRTRSRRTYRYRYFLLTLLTYGLAGTIWYLDLRGIVCFPTSVWFQGHAIWHLLNALVFVWLARFYLQFYK